MPAFAGGGGSIVVKPGMMFENLHDGSPNFLCCSLTQWRWTEQHDWQNWTHQTNQPINIAVTVEVCKMAAPMVRSSLRLFLRFCNVPKTILNTTCTTSQSCGSPRPYYTSIRGLFEICGIFYRAILSSKLSTSHSSQFTLLVQLLMLRFSLAGVTISFFSCSHNWKTMHYAGRFSYHQQ